VLDENGDAVLAAHVAQVERLGRGRGGSAERERAGEK
jgi:hypothetical protein